jgi:hypothetical protein
MNHETLKKTRVVLNDIFQKYFNNAIKILEICSGPGVSSFEIFKDLNVSFIRTDSVPFPRETGVLKADSYTAVKLYQSVVDALLVICPPRDSPAFYYAATHWKKAIIYIGDMGGMDDMCGMKSYMVPKNGWILITESIIYKDSFGSRSIYIFANKNNTRS